MATRLRALVAAGLDVVRRVSEDFVFALEDTNGRIATRARAIAAAEREVDGGPATGLRPFRSAEGLKHTVTMDLLGARFDIARRRDDLAPSPPERRGSKDPRRGHVEMV